jgi:magnesium chelatase family protein
MSIAVVYSRAQLGLEAPPVAVEVHLTPGLPGLAIVGLPEAEVKESKERVRSALLNAQFEFPARRITINLAPADLPKEGGRFDLPIAIGILAASGQLPRDGLERYEFLGELALTGELRPIRGALSAALMARPSGRTLVLPAESAAEAALAEGVEALAASHLLEVTAHLHGRQALMRASPPAGPDSPDGEPYADLSDVKGQAHAKRALEIAAAGGHSLLFIGPPGAGKSMLAARLPGLLPPLSEREALETAAVYSLLGAFKPALWRRRPFRAPHHTASAAAMVGGGTHPRPGEISLAHHGVLFLDELPEFDRRVLEVLREPLESGTITIARAARAVEFPARFQLVAAMNPCPCGYLGDPAGRCRCSPAQVQGYRARLSGPLLDRIDMHVEVPPVPRAQLLASEAARSEENSAAVRARVEAARARQLARAPGRLNAQLEGREIESACALNAAGRALLEQALARLGLSARAYHRILKLARTIADLAGSERVEPAHLAEAIQYRCLDRALAN